MTNLTLLAISGLIIFGIARYNRSNKLFWQLLMSFVFGFACAHGGAMIKNHNTKDGTTISTPMHQSSSFIDTITDDVATFEENHVVLATHYASQGRIDRDIVPYTSIKPSAPLEENKGGPPEFINTS